MTHSLFAPLEPAEPQLARLGSLATRYLHEDPNTALLKLRQYAELFAQTVAARSGLARVEGETQFELLRRLSLAGALPGEVFTLLDGVRREGNAANHALSGDAAGALEQLKFCWILGVWFVRAFVDPEYRCGEFEPPTPAGGDAAERERLRQEVEAARPQEVPHLAALEAAALPGEQPALRERMGRAARNLPLTEAETRVLIDAQLRAAGWEADSVTLRFSQGARPEKGKNRAIAEWPTGSGPADYVLFLGLTPVGVVEAKRKHLNVSDALGQAQRYSRDFSASSAPELSPPGGPWDGHALPFAYASNGRPYLRQLHEGSGVWFRDVRRGQNLAGPLGGWHTPEGLSELLRRDVDAAEARLEREALDYDLGLRPYQKDAIKAVERGIAAGRRSLLLAMATGTGKTKTCIALIYRLLKAQRFSRILFLVDRTSLGEQAQNAFLDTRMEKLRTFADTFGLSTLEHSRLEAGTSVQVATVQGLVKRLLSPAEGEAPLAVDAYDCIVIDECHRGYTLDRELGDVELGFRDEDDYVSQYRRTLEHFDAVKIGLTATPALHTVGIFGAPVYTYSYREAVLDGYLIDHAPRTVIETELSRSGIAWKAGETVQALDPRTGELHLYETPDDIGLEVAQFNKAVLTESFNREVCRALAQEIDPALPEKTLIFCATDAHADLVVRLLKDAFAAQYGEVQDAAVVKITGRSDRPLERIARFKNERLPSVAVTVDLLTTGIDVPEIGNVVFLRRVRSRILYEQMLGRATRRCDRIGKERFRVFDAVGVYDALKPLSSMTPVVARQGFDLVQLEGELLTVTGDDARALVRDQFLARLQAKKGHLSPEARADLEARTGMPLEGFLNALRGQSPQTLAAWYAPFAGLGERLERPGSALGRMVLVSEHEDRLISVHSGYGTGQRPEDYLESFSAYLIENRDRLPALVALLTRPRDLKRKELRSLVQDLDQHGFTEAQLEGAWREARGEEVAAKLLGFIRAVAAGEAPLAFEARVDAALKRLLSSRAWSGPQEQWLGVLAKQTKANGVVDAEALEDPAGVWKREGGLSRLDRLFEGQWLETLATFNTLVWEQAA